MNNCSNKYIINDKTFYINKIAQGYMKLLERIERDNIKENKN